MEDIKDYLERIDTECWERLRKNPSSWIDRIESDDITTEVLCNMITEDIDKLNKSMSSLLEKVDRCLEMQEGNLATVKYINEIITT